MSRMSAKLLKASINTSVGSQLSERCALMMRMLVPLITKSTKTPSPLPSLGVRRGTTTQIAHLHALEAIA
eukprot:2163440-Amphidinium_carterae.1